MGQEHPLCLALSGSIEIYSTSCTSVHGQLTWVMTAFCHGAVCVRTLPGFCGGSLHAVSRANHQLSINSSPSLAIWACRLLCKVVLVLFVTVATLTFQYCENRVDIVVRMTHRVGVVHHELLLGSTNHLNHSNEGHVLNWSVLHSADNDREIF